MIRSTLTLAGRRMAVYSLNTVVVGTGTAGYNAADRLWSFGQRDIAIVTEHINAGTSRNTGSDKQTYYKLTLSGGDPDSVRDMAQTLFDGQCMDGDNALCEAALSAQSFLRLVELGVPFPRNAYGEYVGYKTDHDPRRRATSVGPYTSKRMTECLQQAVEAKGIPVLENLQVISILSDGQQAWGLLCLDLKAADDPERRFVAFNCKNIIYATGGPAGMYADSVFPRGHYGASGAAFEAGAKGQNLTEWQYGLASVNPRWNVSGTYMQVLPCFLSTDQNGGDPREFLMDFFSNRGEMLTQVFLKGYQWPFDVRKVAGGSSIVDILVYLESCKGRKVYLDFRRNPCGGAEIDYAALSPEARTYLEQAGACFGTPLERLLHMNKPAVDFYLDRGVDLAKQPLEIALCAQHNNGGLAVNKWWQTNVEGLFACGEVSGSHGVYRPGGSALNETQVGSTRAAQYIAARRSGQPPDEVVFVQRSQALIERQAAVADAALQGDVGNVQAIWDEAATRMSRFGACIRSKADLEMLRAEVAQRLSAFPDTVRAGSHRDLWKVYRLRDTLIAQQVYLSAMLDYIARDGKSRGSALYTDPGGVKPYESLPDVFTFTVDDGHRAGLVQEVEWQQGKCLCRWRKVRPIPEDDDFFENVWRSYRESGNIDP